MDEKRHKIHIGSFYASGFLLSLVAVVNISKFYNQPLPTWAIGVLWGIVEMFLILYIVWFLKNESLFPEAKPSDTYPFLSNEWMINRTRQRRESSIFGLILMAVMIPTLLLVHFLLS